MPTLSYYKRRITECEDKARRCLDNEDIDGMNHQLKEASRYEARVKEMEG